MAPAFAAHPIRVEGSIVATYRVEMSTLPLSDSSFDASTSLFSREREAH